MRRVQLGEMDEYHRYPYKEPGDIFEYKGRLVLTTTKDSMNCYKCVFSIANNGRSIVCGQLGAPHCNCGGRSVRFEYLDSSMENP